MSAWYGDIGVWLAKQRKKKINDMVHSVQSNSRPTLRTSVHVLQLWHLPYSELSAAIRIAATHGMWLSSFLHKTNCSMFVSNDVSIVLWKCGATIFVVLCSS